jgi:sugar/nucleoside kinase (ribokinase family)
MKNWSACWRSSAWPLIEPAPSANPGNPFPVMINSAELRQTLAAKLTKSAGQVPALRAFVGLDGFVDEIYHVVNTRKNAEEWERLPTIAAFAERLAAAAGKSTNIELVPQLTKLGGNGPIMANALASFGLKVSYLGALGYPKIRQVFDAFTQVADVHSIAPPGHTNALEFEDGKLMLSSNVQLNDVNWRNIEERFGRDQFAGRFQGSDLVAFVNWTMVPYMSDIWEVCLKELLPPPDAPRRWIFFDLADPQKRADDDIKRALQLIVRFNERFNVILGLNEKEAYEVSEAIGIPQREHSPENLAQLTLELNKQVPVDTIVVHPVAYALAASHGEVTTVKGPYIPKPKITTGAGDHFNSGFCLGKLLGLSNTEAVLTGVSTSGFYVKNAQSPAVTDLAAFLNDWPG